MMEREAIRIVAEMACSHAGDPATAAEIILAAGKAKADAIQFQIWDPAGMVTHDHPDLRALRRLQLTQNEWHELADLVREETPGLDIIACVYESQGLAIAEELGVSAYKIHAADLANPHLLRAVGAKGKPIHLSVGASTIEEIAISLDLLGWGDEDTGHVTLMYGLQAFPTPEHAVDLSYMAGLGRFFRLPFGYQDHTDPTRRGAVHLPLAAAAQGASILEKHLALDPTADVPDAESAMSPGAFATFVADVRALEPALRPGVPQVFSQEEEEYRTYAKKSIVASRPLEAGRVLRLEDLALKRTPNPGLTASSLQGLLGRRLLTEVEKDERLGEEDVA